MRRSLGYSAVQAFSDFKYRYVQQNYKERFFGAYLLVFTFDLNFALGTAAHAITSRTPPNQWIFAGVFQYRYLRAFSTNLHLDNCKFIPDS